MRRFSIILTLSAWLLATGAQWDLVQVFAWGQMFAANARAGDIGAAIEKTFLGKMCPICSAVQQAKQQERDGPVVPVGKVAKPELVLTKSVEVFGSAAPLLAGRFRAGLIPASAEAAPPLGPPPRVLA